MLLYVRSSYDLITQNTIAILFSFLFIHCILNYIVSRSRQILASAIPVSVLYPGKPAVIKKKAGTVRQRSGPNFSIRAKSVFYITH